MALGTQRVNLQFRGGIDSKTNDQLVIPSKLVRAENVEFDADTVQRRKALQVRSGTTAGELGYMPVRMFTHGNSLIVEDQYGTHRRVGGAEFNERQLRVAAQTLRQGSLDARTAKTFDCAVDPDGNMLVVREVMPTGGNATGIAWELRDRTGIVTREGNYGGGAGVAVIKPQVRWSVARNTFYIWCINSQTSTTALVQRLDIINSLISNEFTISVALPGEQRQICYDVNLRAFTAGSGGELYGIAACNPRNAAQGLYGRVFDLTTNTLIWGGTTALTTLDNIFSLAVFAGDIDTGSSSYIAAMLVFYTTLGDSTVKRRGLGNLGANSWDTAITVTSDSGQAGRIVVDNIQNDKNNLILIHDTVSGVQNNAWRGVRTSVVKLPCKVNAAAAIWKVFLRGESFVSTQLSYVRGRQVLGLSFNSKEFQSVFMLVDTSEVVENSTNGVFTTVMDAPVFARIDWGDTVAPTLGYDSNVQDEVLRPPNPMTLSGDDVWFPYTSWATNTRLAQGANVTSVALSFVRIDGRSQLGEAAWNGTRVLAGALPLLCDGESIVEEGFNFNPEVYDANTVGSVGGTVTLTPNATGPIELPEEGKTYSLAFTVAWQDANGNWYESGFGALARVVTTVGNKQITPYFAVPPTKKKGVQVLMYRSLANAQDTTLYLVGALDSTGFVDVKGDTLLTASEVLYTEGGVLPNTPCPPCRHLETYQDRIVASGNGSKVFFSKTRSLGFGAEFVSDQLAFQLNAPADYGRVVGTATEGDTLLVFGESVIGIVYGAGPDNTGVGNFQSVTEVIHDRGALWESPKSIKQTREGVWFHSRDGLRLVAGNTLAVANNMEVGAEFDSQIPGEFNGYLPRVVTLSEPTVGGLPQTRFVFTYLWEAGNAADAGAYLASWHSMWSQFTAFTNHIAVDAETSMVSGRSAYHLLSYDGSDSAVVRYRSETQSPSDAWVDGTTSDFASLVRTSWIQFAGVQGYQRAKRLLLLGRVLELSGGSTMDYELNLRYDFDDDEASFVQEFAVSGAALANTFQFWHQIGRQKCEALQAEFVWTPRTNPSTLRLTDMALDIGVKGTFRKATKL